MNSPRLALGGQKRASLAGLTPFLPVLVFLALLYFAPLLMLLSRSVISAGGEWTASYFGQLFASTAYIHSLWITIKISAWTARSEEHTSELQSLMRISYAVFCLKQKKQTNKKNKTRLKR